tara:strand:+ start:19839 stop:20789 length:951 start_codon:yes stop_codon:yes gene_type:complete
MIFIIGAPRSGTKLLREILNNHSEIYIPEAETLFLYKLYLSWEQFGELSIENNFNKLFDYILNTPFYSYLQDEGDEWIVDKNSWFQRCTEWNYSHVMTKFFESCASKKEKCLFGDKTPSYLYPVDFIRSQFSGAKIIHIVRDPRDYGLSVKKAWNKNLYRSVYRWNDWISQTINQLGSKDDFIQVKYEDLIESPKDVMKEVMLFLNVNYEESLFTFTKRVEPVGDAKNQNTIMKGNFGKWESVLSNKKIKRIEELCFESMKIVGYSPKLASKNDKLSALGLKYYKALDAINLLKTSFKKDGFKGFKRQIKLISLSQ